MMDFRWIRFKQTVIDGYGHISSQDVSSVTDMTNLFQNKTTFNDDIGNWDVSGVNNMSGMFNRALKFNQDISWNVLV